MDSERRCDRVLLVGDESSLSRAEIAPHDGVQIEIVSSLAEAVARHASGGYARVVVDPAALDASQFEVLAPGGGIDFRPSQTAGSREVAGSSALSEDTLSDSGPLLTRILSGAEAAIAVVDVVDGGDEFRFAIANRACAEWTGVPEGRWIGKRPQDLFELEIAERMCEQYRKAITSPEGFTFEERLYDHRIDGRWGLTTIHPLADCDGLIYQLVITSVDITPQKQATESEERLLALMNHNPSLVFLKDEQGRYVYLNHAYEEAYALSPDWYGKTDDDFWPADSAKLFRENDARVMASGLTHQFLEDSFDRDGSRHCWLCYKFPFTDSQGKHYIGGIGIDMVSRVETEEALQQMRAESERQREELYLREHHIAEVLQNAIVPPRVPSEITGCRIAVAYRPAMREAKIGGDFFDVFELADNKVGILIGDVAGKGLEAALRVASVRHAVRNYAYLDPRPARVLTLANQSLCRAADQETQMLTAFLGVLDADAGILTYSSAGHEPPVVRLSDGRFEALSMGGVALGLLPGAEYPHYSRRLDPGELVAMVTDGITEARTHGVVLFGIDGLRRALSESNCSSPEDAVEVIIDSATRHAGGELQDDAAVVVFTPA